MRKTVYPTFQIKLFWRLISISRLNNNQFKDRLMKHSYHYMWHDFLALVFVKRVVSKSSPSFCRTNAACKHMCFDKTLQKQLCFRRNIRQLSWIGFQAPTRTILEAMNFLKKKFWGHQMNHRGPFRVQSPLFLSYKTICQICRSIGGYLDTKNLVVP